MESSIETAREWLAPFAERVLTALEDPEQIVAPPQTPKRDLARELLEGEQPVPAPAPPAPAALTPEEVQTLRRDFEEVLRQRSQLRAQLVVEQERRERAEAELVAIGAQWLGTDTQEALRRRAEAERRRELDEARAAIAREAEQRIARVQAEKALLLRRLGSDGPSAVGLKLELRRALHAELSAARLEAREAVRDEMAQLRTRADRLSEVLRVTEARHSSELGLLRDAVKKASALMGEQYDQGFVAGLKASAAALGEPTGGSGHASLSGSVPPPTGDSARETSCPAPAAGSLPTAEGARDGCDRGESGKRCGESGKRCGESAVGGVWRDGSSGDAADGSPRPERGVAESQPAMSAGCEDSSEGEGEGGGKAPGAAREGGNGEMDEAAETKAVAMLTATSTDAKAHASAMAALSSGSSVGSSPESLRSRSGHLSGSSEGGVLQGLALCVPRAAADVPAAHAGRGAVAPRHSMFPTPPSGPTWPRCPPQVASEPNPFSNSPDLAG